MLALFVRFAFFLWASCRYARYISSTPLHQTAPFAPLPESDHTNVMATYFYSCYFVRKGFPTLRYFTTPVPKYVHFYLITTDKFRDLIPPYEYYPLIHRWVKPFVVLPQPVYVRRGKGQICVIAYVKNVFQYYQRAASTVWCFLRPNLVRDAPRCRSQTPLLLFDIAKVRTFFKYPNFFYIFLQKFSNFFLTA